jgi:hypothetical protein
VTYEDGQEDKAYEPWKTVEVDLGECMPSERFAKTVKPCSSPEEKYAPFNGCGIKNWRRFIVANRNDRRNPINGKSMSVRNDTRPLDSDIRIWA